METLKSIKSSNITAYGYEPGAKKLTIQFRSGTQYSYSGVEPDVVKAFETADSPGGFFASNVRKQYPCENTTPVKEA